MQRSKIESKILRLKIPAATKPFPKSPRHVFCAPPSRSSCRQFTSCCQHHVKGPMGDPPAARAHAPRMQKVLKCALHPGAGVGQGVWSVVGRSTGEGVCGGGGSCCGRFFLSPQPCPVSPPQLPTHLGQPCTRHPPAHRSQLLSPSVWLIFGCGGVGVWGVGRAGRAFCALCYGG